MQTDRPNVRKRKHLYRELLDRDGPYCYYCGVLFETAIRKRRMTIDHKTPLARDGSNDLRNLVLACNSCNARKGTMLAEEFLASDIVEERRTSVIGQMMAHNHEAILFTPQGNWSCLCGSFGTASDVPKNTSCTLTRYGVFYRPTG